MVTAKFVHPENGYPSDVEKSKKVGLVVGCDYPVSNISIGQSYTNVFLEDFPGAFNSVQFEFYENGEPINIFRDWRFNPYIGRRNMGKKISPENM